VTASCSGWTRCRPTICPTCTPSWGGVRRDQDAVAAGLTLPWSSGPVEGHVNRLKMLKRQMFGRAKLDLLSRRFLRAA